MRFCSQVIEGRRFRAQGRGLGLLGVQGYRLRKCVAELRMETEVASHLLREGPTPETCGGESPEVWGGGATFQIVPRPKAVMLTVLDTYALRNLLIEECTSLINRPPLI